MCGAGLRVAIAFHSFGVAMITVIIRWRLDICRYNAYSERQKDEDMNRCTVLGIGANAG
jgi:hypothetical protein